MSGPAELLVVRVSDGATVSLESIWQERRVALVFLRHLGCRFCLEQTDALVQSGLARRLQEFDVPLAAVSLGSLADAREWLQKTGFAGELYVDSSTDGSVAAESQGGSLSYRAFKLKRGRDCLFKRKDGDVVAEKFPDQFTRHSDGDVVIYPGDVFQVGGGFVVGPGNTCDFSSRSAYAGDLLDMEALEVAATGNRFDGTEYVYPSTAAWFERLDFGKRISAAVAASSMSLWSHRLQPLILHYWQPVATSCALVAALETARQKKVVASASFLGVGGLIAAYGVIAHRRDRLVNKVKIFSPKAVDEMVLTLGLMECDCSGVLSSINMDSTTDGTEGFPASLPRARTKTWAITDFEGNAPNEYQSTLCYVRQFLAKPHPAVGRTGPVCPFVPKSLQLDTVKLGVVRTRDIPRHQLRSRLTQLLVDFIPRFEAMEPTKGRQRQYKTVIFIFPDVALLDANDVIDGAQADAKPNFVEKGLMVGEFHAANNASGLRNPNFYPLRTPHPCLAIRHMVPGDFVFMTLDNYPVDLQRKFLASFLDVFGEEDREETRNARKQLDKLQGGSSDRSTAPSSN